MQRLAVAAALLLSGCASSEDREFIVASTEPPDATVQREIVRLVQDPSATSKLSISRVEYLGTEAFLVQSPCCDRFNYLYDKNGRILCAPSGGIAGRGDGRCRGSISHRRSPGTTER